MSIGKNGILICAILAAIILGTLGIRWVYDQTGHAAQVAAAKIPQNISTDAIIGYLQDYLKTHPDDYVAYGNLGGAYLQKVRENGDATLYTKAEGVLNKALALHPNDFRALSNLGALALARHQFRDALTRGEQARAVNPDNASIYGVIGDAQIELGLYDDAFATFQQMVDIRPDLTSYARVSYARELQGDRAGAIENMQRAVNAGALNTEARSWALTQLGTLYFDQNEYDKAAQAYQAALDGWHNYPYARAGLANVRAAQGDYEAAIEIYTSVVNTIPLPQFVIALGDLYHAAGQDAQAEKTYALVGVEEQLLAANGVDIDAETALFDADHGRDLPNALARARAAYARRSSVTVADILAWTLYQSGDYSAADEIMHKALRLGTRSALMFYHAAVIAHALGHDDAAENYLQQALTLNPHFSFLYADRAQKLWTELSQRHSSGENFQTRMDNLQKQ
jgi:tetratricopeptide (TPR) repeat protein